MRILFFTFLFFIFLSNRIVASDFFSGDDFNDCEQYLQDLVEQEEFSKIEEFVSQLPFFKLENNYDLDKEIKKWILYKNILEKRISTTPSMYEKIELTTFFLICGDAVDMFSKKTGKKE